MTNTGSTTNATGPVLVVGGTGKTGARVAALLRERGVPVRTAARSRADVAFDWHDATTWPAALDGARAAYLTFAPDLAVPGSVALVRALAEAAVARGVTRLVLLSGRGEEEAQRAEEALFAVAPDASVVRASWFMQNFSESYLLDPLLEGVVALPTGSVPEPFVDADDIAAVAVAALTGDGHAGRVYEVTGPRALTFAEAVEEIGRAAGRELTYVPVSLEEYAAGAMQAGVPEDIVALLRYLFGEVLGGDNVVPADGVERALGRPARDFADYARDTAATGVWAGARTEA